MKRMSITLISFGIVIASSCGGNKPQPTSQPFSSPTPAATVVPPVAAPSAGPEVKATIPALIPERLRRPLTREEIMKLPPATRDMILRAQGRPLPTPTKKP